MFSGGGLADKYGVMEGGWRTKNYNFFWVWCEEYHEGVGRL